MEDEFMELRHGGEGGDDTNDTDDADDSSSALPQRPRWSWRPPYTDVSEPSRG
jgi:hypothetical protein